jgi:hypothetical protein
MYFEKVIELVDIPDSSSILACIKDEFSMNVMGTNSAIT